mgnify:CR=1 FL=1
MRVFSIVASVFLLSMLFAACTGDSSREREEKRVQAVKAVNAERDAAVAQATEEFTAAHKGDEKWQASLEKQKLTTYALQQTLIRPAGQAIVAGVSVVDVAKEGDSLRFHLLASSLLGGFLYKQFVLFDLKCALADVKYDKLKSDPFTPEFLPDYLVAARIHEVKSARRVLLSKADSIEFATEFTATGECLGLKDIGSIRKSYDPQLSALEDPRRKPIR